MGSFLIILLTLCKLKALTCEIAGSRKLTSNSLENIEFRPLTTKANRFREELNPEIDFLDDPLASINIDYLNNAVIFQFRRSIPDDDNEIEAKRRSSVDKNFMRFGRADRSRMRFGKRQLEDTKDQHTLNSLNQAETRSERSEVDSSRNSRADSFMRFGRPDGSLMRFGRAGNSMMRFGRGNENLMRFGRQSGKNLMRLGRSNGMMRFGRSKDQHLMRFGKRDNSLMRFGRSEDGIPLKGRSDGFMRFGRMVNQASEDSYESDFDEKSKIFKRGDGGFTRFVKSDNNFMRFGKLDRNFMRFGKRSEVAADLNENARSFNKIGNNFSTESRYEDSNQLFRFNRPDSEDADDYQLQVMEY